MTCIFAWLFFSDRLTLIVKALHTVEMSASTRPVTWCHILRTLVIIYTFIIFAGLVQVL